MAARGSWEQERVFHLLSFHLLFYLSFFFFMRPSLPFFYVLLILNSSEHFAGWSTPFPLLFSLCCTSSCLTTLLYTNAFIIHRQSINQTSTYVVAADQPACPIIPKHLQPSITGTGEPTEHGSQSSSRRRRRQHQWTQSPTTIWCHPSAKSISPWGWGNADMGHYSNRCSHHLIACIDFLYC